MIMLCCVLFVVWCAAGGALAGDDWHLWCGVCVSVGTL